MRRTASSLAAVLALTVGACGPDGEAAGPRSPSPAAPSPTGAPDQSPAGTGAPASPDGTERPTGQPFPANTEPDEADGSGQPVVITDIEVARNEGFDRVVLEVGGGGRPGWVVEYVERPTAQGSGDEVEVAGDATLEVRLSNVALPPESEAQAYEGPDRIRPDGTEVIEEVVYGTTFEGQTQLWIGLDREVPFRVQWFEDPGRVVIDVVHADRVS